MQAAGLPAPFEPSRVNNSSMPDNKTNLPTLEATPEAAAAQIAAMGQAHCFKHRREPRHTQNP